MADTSSVGNEIVSDFEAEESEELLQHSNNNNNQNHI